MYKRLRVYYLYTALPFIFLLLSAFIYRKAIIKTIVSNPHPQVNYIIFAITLVGGVLILMNISKLMQEGRKLAEFVAAKRGGAEAKALQELALNYDADVAYVLRMIAASSGRSISHQEQIAIETELHKASDRINSRNAIPQFLGGLLVGMGLLGTFIGLLATLDDIATLISSFGSLDMKTADPIAVFSQMVKRMEAPMHSMGIAFSASMYGLLGSIILGFMMVSVRRCISEIMSILGSEVAQHIEFALARDGFIYSKGAIRAARRSGEELSMRDVVMPEVLGVASGSSAKSGNGTSATAVNVKAEAGAAGVRTEYEEGQFSDEVRVLRRIEERIADSVRIQERGIGMEIEDFQKQRADMLRALADNSEASTHFRSELQRVGRQLGSMLEINEKSNTDMLDQVRELRLTGTDSANETHRLIAQMVDLQREVLDELRAAKR